MDQTLGSADPTPVPRNHGAGAMSITVGLAALITVIPMGEIAVIAFVPALIVIALAAFVFAVPAYLAARSLGIDSAWTAAGTGIVTAMLPTLMFPRGPVQGPMAGALILAIGLGGAAAGIFFQMVVTWPGTPRWHRIRLGAAVVALIAAAYALFFVQFSASAVWREAPRSSTSVAMLELHVAKSEWPALQGELARFAGERQWPVRADVRPDFPWFQATIGPDEATHISLDHLPIDQGYISIAIFQPQGGTGWRPVLRALQDRLEARWPGKVSDDTPQPPWGKPKPFPSPTPSSTEHRRQPASPSM